jgi:hypothetical protein
MTRQARGAVLTLVAVVVLVAHPGRALAVYECGGESDTCSCGGSNFCLCDGTCGNCVWHAWHSACCGWGRALEWCTDAGTWDEYARDNGYPTGGDPRGNSVFVCNPSGTCSGWGHVGWVVRAYPDGSFDSTEQFWGGPCGTHDRHRSAGFATAGFIYDPGGGSVPTEIDDADYVSETVPDGTHFGPDESFDKHWTLRNTGNTTWTRGGSYLLTFDGDERFGAAEQTLLPEGASVAPGATFEFSVPMVAPASPGTYRGYWRMDRFGTGRFGDRIWVEIVVDDRPVDADGDGVVATEDCDDHDASVHPGADEACNGRDDDCDGETDEGVLNRCGACGPEPDEVCDGADNDCDGRVDEGCPGSDAGPDDGGAEDAGDDGGHDGGDVPWDGGGWPREDSGPGINYDMEGGCTCRQSGSGGASAPFLFGLVMLSLLALARWPA